MTPHSLCWARINSPQFIHRFNHITNLMHSTCMHMTDVIQKTDIHLYYIFFLILHRATRKTITFKMVLAGLKSVDEKYANSNLKSAHPRLLSIGDDDCASPPCDSPGRYGR